MLTLLMKVCLERFHVLSTT